VDDANGIARLNGREIKAGDWISLNGTTGEVVAGKQPLKAPEMSGVLGRFMEWVDSLRTLQVLTNADTPEDAAEARRFGAGGIGLCRTEHMFFASEERIRCAPRQWLTGRTTGVSTVCSRSPCCQLPFA
jgi:pyruvate, orthophosphate dikinase